MGAMGTSNRYSPEVRERAVRLVREHQAEHTSQWAAIESIAAKSGATPQSAAKAVLRHSILDDAALVAVKLSQSFPPVPDSLCKNTLGMTGTFRYQVKRK
jgi:hypothetical protein